MKAAEPNEMVQILDWDSEFFGSRIARVNETRIDQRSLENIDKWCKANHIDCVYYLADTADTESVRLAEKSGFHLVDLRVTLEKKLSPLPGPWQSLHPHVRLSTPLDIAALRSLAAVNHRDSRFYHDGGFPSERCDELFATWIEKSCKGYADVVLVADTGSGAVGYLSCHLKKDGWGQIGLVGVSESCRGEGLGKLLLEESQRWFASNEVKNVAVVTQGRNAGAQRLYQKSGFVTQSIQLWYHKWFL